MLLHLALEAMGQYLVSAQRAQAVAQAAAIAGVYQNSFGAQHIAREHKLQLCGYIEPDEFNNFVTVCIQSQRVQRWARATDSWANTMPTLDK